MVDVVFQAMFACLTVGLIAGALADRMKFGAWIIAIKIGGQQDFVCPGQAQVAEQNGRICT